MSHNYIFQVINDCDTVLMTRSEHKAYRIAKELEHPWIVATVLDNIPCWETTYDIEEFGMRYL